MNYNENMEHLPQQFNIENSPMREAYELLGAKTPFELSQKFTEVQREPFLSGTWDLDDQNLIQNKVKIILEATDESGLSEEEKVWRNEILWFWYHHAISIAIKAGDRTRALACSEKALALQDEDDPKRNKMTKLLNLLLNDKLEEAEAFATSIPQYKLDDGNDNPEPETARELIESYKQGGFR